MHMLVICEELCLRASDPPEGGEVKDEAVEAEVVEVSGPDVGTTSRLRIELAASLLLVSDGAEAFLDFTGVAEE